MISFLHDDLTSLYKLIERLLAQFEDGETQIIAGKLPALFPNKIPFPSNATIIGSTVYHNQWHDRTQVFFDVRLELQQLNNFYQNNLGKSWKKKEYERVGFERFSDSVPESLEHMCFIDQTQNIELNIEMNEARSSQKESITQVLLDIWKLNHIRLSYAPLPVLLAPPDVNILRSTGGYGEKESNSEAKLKTHLNLQELITHYADCFEQKGWVESDSGQKQNFAWRNWKMRDENDQTWSGVLQITSLAEVEHYLASARVFQKEN